MNALALMDKAQQAAASAELFLKVGDMLGPTPRRQNRYPAA
jgi:hypothetical protein